MYDFGGAPASTELGPAEVILQGAVNSVTFEGFSESMNPPECGLARAHSFTFSAPSASAMLAQGLVNSKQVIGSQGNMAPMIPVGAAPEDGQIVAPEQERAAKLRKRHVGGIFGHLLEAAKKKEIIVAEGGYNLTSLATAIELWLEQRFKKMPDPEDSAASETSYKPNS